MINLNPGGDCFSNARVFFLFPFAGRRIYMKIQALLKPVVLQTETWAKNQRQSSSLDSKTQRIIFPRLVYVIK